MKMLRLVYNVFTVFLFVVIMLVVYVTTHFELILLGIPVLALFLASALGALFEEADK